MKKKKITFWDYVKPFWLPLMVSIAFLAFQAYGQLTLPDYMSKVVDVGIGQGGVEHPAVEAIRMEQMNTLLLFMEDDDRELVKSNYRMVRREDASASQKRKYPILDRGAYESFLEDYEDSLPEAVGTIFIRKTDKKEVMGELNRAFETPQAILQLARSADELKDIDFSVLSRDDALSLRKEVDAYFREMGDVEGTIKNLAIITAQREYKEMGMNMPDLQTSFIQGAAIQMIILTVFIVLAVGTEVYLAARIAAGLGKKLRSDMFSKVISLSNNEFDQFSTASLITRTTNDVNQIQNMLSIVLRILVFSPIMAVGALLKISNTAPNMRWIIAVAVFIITVVIIVLFRLIMPRFKRMQELLDKVNLVLRESLSGLLVVRAFNKEAYQEEKFAKANDDLTSNMNFVGRIMVLLFPLISVVFDLTIVAIVWFGAKQVDLGFLGVGDLMAFIQYAMQLLQSFLMITMLSMIVPRALISIKRIFEVLNSESSIVESNNPKTIASPLRGEVEYRNVSFQYQDADEGILEDVSFVAAPGKTTAFIGSTGSGKSTLINLLPRFYDATKGDILIDGVNIKDISLYDLRAHLGFTPQQGLLFSGDIESNIKFGDKDISDEEMKRAAEIAQAAEFIVNLDETYHAPIAQKGTNVSGGQRQRLSIARSIANRPDILIFDDSFSALDFKTDAALRKALHENLSDKTILIVAQRIGTIRHADQIVVLDDGKIVGKGTHLELMRDNQIYKEIAMSQLSEEELKGDVS